SLFSLSRPLPCSALFPYTTLFRSGLGRGAVPGHRDGLRGRENGPALLADVTKPRDLAPDRVDDDIVAPVVVPVGHVQHGVAPFRSEEHTSELQSRENLVCRLLLEK